MPKYEVQLRGATDTHVLVVEAETAGKAEAKWRDHWGIITSVYPIQVTELIPEATTLAEVVAPPAEMVVETTTDAPPETVSVVTTDDVETE